MRRAEGMNKINSFSTISKNLQVGISSGYCRHYRLWLVLFRKPPLSHTAHTPHTIPTRIKISAAAIPHLFTGSNSAVPARPAIPTKINRKLALVNILCSCITSGTPCSADFQTLPSLSETYPCVMCVYTVSLRVCCGTPSAGIPSDSPFPVTRK